MTTFIGHRICDGVSCEDVKNEIRKLIQKGSSVFLSGGLGEFDRICAKNVYELKKDFPEIKNYLIIPYTDFIVFSPEYFDETIFPEELERIPYKIRIMMRNRCMVDKAAYALCYVNNSFGGAGKTYEYAKRKGIKLINLGRFG